MFGGIYNFLFNQFFYFMKSSNVFSFLLLISISVLFFNCTDTKSEFVGKWEMESSFVNGTSEPKTQKIVWTFFEDGDFLQSLTENDSIEELKGSWSLNDEETVLILHYQTTGQDVSWKIVEMEENAMDIEYTTKGFLVERRFVRVE